MIWETDWLAGRARLTPDREAIINGETGERLTYRQLHERAKRMAGCFRRQGIGKGDRIAILAPNHSAHFELLFACSQLGAVFVPLNFRLAVEELSYIISDCRPKAVLYDPCFSVLATEVSQNTDVPFLTADEVYTSSTGADEAGSVDVRPSDPFMIIYTGGTTGRPKGVVLLHQNVFWNSVNTIVSWGIGPQDVTVTYLPLFHTGGLNALSLPVLHAGGKVILGPKFTPEAAVQTIEKEQCTIVLLVPTMYHMLIQSKAFAQADFSSMHTFLSGGAPCPHSIYEAFERRGVLFKEGYGLTEAGPNNFYIAPEEVKRKRGSVGKPMIHCQVKIVDETGRETAPLEVGELWIQGHHVFERYYNRPRETAEAKQDGWLKTGDLARRDAEGFYYIVGRKKEMIITGGENVYPQEIEQVLDRHPDIDEAVVVGLPDEKWGETVAAAIVLKPGRALAESELKDYLAKHLGSYKIPRNIFFLRELKKTAVGKIDRKEMFAMLRSMQEQGEFSCE